jgi:RND family efflux transporter MFP subunit
MVRGIFICIFYSFFYSYICSTYYKKIDKKIDKGELMKRLALVLLVPIALLANKPKASLVNVAPIGEGVVNELQKFVGTTTFSRSSNIASSSSGIVTKVRFSDGEYVNKSQILVELDTDVINAEVTALQASLKQSQLELEQANKDLLRYDSLIKSGAITQKAYDDQKFSVAKLNSKVITNQSNLKAKKILRDKKYIKAPYSGIITKKSIEIGEWANSGSVVATIVDTSAVDVEYSVPASYLSFINKGDSYSVIISNKPAKATVYAIIPQGDMATRTFPLKLRVKTKAKVFEGMQTSINLASTKERKSLTVPRDAVIKKFGQDVVFANLDGKAKMIPVKVVGYKKDLVAIEGMGIKKGMPIVVKGNERIFPNSAIKVIPSK